MAESFTPSPNPFTIASNTSASTPLVDLNLFSSYNIHSSNNLGASLVSKLLISDNYYSWSRALEMALNAKNKWGFIEGSLLQPPTTSPIYSLWDHVNDMIISWILNVLSV